MPPELLETARAVERGRVGVMEDNIRSGSARSAGLRSDTAAREGLTTAVAARVTGLTRIISARDDRHGIFAGDDDTASRIEKARSIGADTEGHV